MRSIVITLKPIQTLRMSIKLLQWLAGFAVCVLMAGCGPTEENQTKTERNLPAIGAHLSQTSVSGISSGAYMAGQFQFAHGDIVIGAAIIAGGPYGCAESTFADIMPGPGTAFLNLSKAVNGCMRNSLEAWGIPNPKLLATKAGKRAERGEISALSTISNDRVYLFAGGADKTVRQEIVNAAHAFYKEIGIGDGQIKFVRIDNAGHAIITEEQGAACDNSGSPYLVDCDYDQAGDLLQHIYGPLAAPAKQTTGTHLRFDQRPFTKGLSDHGLAVTGAAYIPNDCRKGACRIHIAFHGCAQSRQFVGAKFIEQAGYVRWADTNKLIILFPQTSSSPVNPQGCWDWWGFTSNDYLTKNAPQIIAVHRMLQHLAETEHQSAAR